MQDLLKTWLEDPSDVDELLSPGERRVIPLVAAGVASEKQLEDAANDELVFAAKSDPRIAQYRVKTGGPLGEKRVNDDGSIPWVLSDESVDRDGDIIRVSGWSLKNFRKNPVLLWGHGREGTEPIGKALNVRRELDGDRKILVGDLKFASEESDRAARIERLAKGGFVNAGSVGFFPIKTHRPESDEERDELGLGRWGVVFQKQDLMEFSPCAVPSNPNALRRAVNDGVIEGKDADLAMATATEKEWEKYIRRQSRSHVSMSTATPGDNEPTVEQMLEVITLDHSKEIRETLDGVRAAMLENSASNKMLARAITGLGESLGGLRLPDGGVPGAGNQRSGGNDHEVVELLSRISDL